VIGYWAFVGVFLESEALSAPIAGGARLPRDVTTSTREAISRRTYRVLGRQMRRAAVGSGATARRAYRPNNPLHRHPSGASRKR
jgi:hypothetical protein